MHSWWKICPWWWGMGLAGNVKANALARKGLVDFKANSALSAEDLHKIETTRARRRDAWLMLAGVWFDNNKEQTAISEEFVVLTRSMDAVNVGVLLQVVGNRFGAWPGQSVHSQQAALDKLMSQTCSSRQT